jgi:hypothetical protein
VRNPDKEKNSPKFEIRVRKSGDGRSSLVEPSKKGKKEKGRRVVRKERDSGDGGGRLQPVFRAQK